METSRRYSIRFLLSVIIVALTVAMAQAETQDCSQFLGDASLDCLEQRVAALTEQNTSLQADNSTLQSTLAALEARIDSIEPRRRLREGLIAHYTFDDCSYRDVSGNGHDATAPRNQPTCISDFNQGKALKFSGDEEFLALPRSKDFESAELSIAMWFRDDMVDDYNGDSFSTLISNYLTFTAAISRVVKDENPRCPQMDVRELAFTVSFSARAWLWCSTNVAIEPILSVYHVVFTVSMEGTVRTFINGQLLMQYHDPLEYSDPKESRLGPPNYIDKSNYFFRIATLYNSSQREFLFFKGVIDNVRFYNRPLSREDVALLYQVEREQTGLHMEEASE